MSVVWYSQDTTISWTVRASTLKLKSPSNRLMKISPHSNCIWRDNGGITG
jgi:hypothetical protein